MSQFGGAGKNPPWMRASAELPLAGSAMLAQAGASLASALSQPQTAVQQQQTQSFGTNLAALGLAQNALQATTVLSQPGLAIPASLATSPQAGLGLSAASLAASGGANLGYGSTQAAAARLLGAAAASTGVASPSTKQRVFTGTVTKLHDNFGFVDEDVFFQTCAIKGTMPKVGERVLVEASYNPNMPFKWNAYRIQLLANQMNASVGVRLNNQIAASSPANTSAAMAAQTQYINSVSSSENKSSRSDGEKISYSQLLERTESRHRAEYANSNARSATRRSSPTRRDRDMRHDDRRDRYRDRNSSRDFDKDRRPYDRNQDRLSDRNSDRNLDRMADRDRIPERDRLLDRDRDRIVDRDRNQDRLADRIPERNRSPIRDRRSRDRDRDRERDRDLRGPAQSPDRDYRGPGQDHDGNSTSSSLTRKHALSPPRRAGVGVSPPRRKPRMMPRYVVDIPAVCLDQRELGVVDLRKRYPNMYIPSDFFHAHICWQECFPLQRPFGLNYPCCFQVLPKDTCPPAASVLGTIQPAASCPPAVLDPTDVNFSFSAKVMLLSSPSLEELYQQTCALAEDESRSGTALHPARVLSFLVGLKGKSETVAIGGPWSLSLDGPNPDSDPQTLIRTAVRTCRALTGIDLSACTQWYRFAEICYRRESSSPANGAKAPSATLEKVVLFFPDVWRCMPTRQEWADLELRLRSADDAAADASAGDATAPCKEEENAEACIKEPTHYADLDPKTMKVGDLRQELEARGLSTKGLKSQLVARLGKALKAEAEMAEGNEEEEEEVEEEAEEEGEEEEPIEEAVLDEVKDEVVDEVKQDEDAEHSDEDRPAADGEAEEDKPTESADVSKEEEGSPKEDTSSRSGPLPAATVGTPLRLDDLPSQPSILVYPSRTAKGGRFDCSVMSLSLLLDYRQEDNKEHSFEVSLFAELFNEMLIRDFGFNIYRALLAAPEQKEEKKKDAGKESDKKVERREDRKSDRRPDRRDRKDDEKKNDDQDESDGASEPSDGEGDSEENKEKRPRKENNRTQQQRTVQRHLLLSFIYFDQNQCGYLQDRDLEDIFYIIGLELSRGQVRRLLQKVSRRETVRYRNLTDAPVCPEDIVEEVPVADEEMADDEEGPGAEQPSEQELGELALGNRVLLSKREAAGGPHPAEVCASGDSVAALPGGTAGTRMVFHDGALLDVAKLLRQVERSERARTSSETRLKELIEALAEVRESWEASRQEVLKTQMDLEQTRRQLVTTEDDLCSSRKTAQELRLALQNCRQHLQATLGSLETVLGRKEHRGDAKKETIDD
ncbi:cell division cycle and apoptosis regulator protein 1-like isoform X1 [Haemaphysalis longicornis]